MLPSIPFELFTLLSSSVMGSLMRIWGSSIQIKRMQSLISLEALQTKNRFISMARTYENRGFQWTRRIIALIAVLSIIVLPKIISIFIPGIPIHIAYQETSKGFLFFTSDTVNTHWMQMKGLVITPLDTHLLSAIIGLYFGGSLASGS